MFYAKKRGDMLAICDSSLIDENKIISNSEITINFKQYADFFGQKTDKQTAIILIKQSTNINAFGERTISLLKKLGLTDDKSVRLIGDVPHTQVYYLKDLKDL